VAAARAKVGRDSGAATRPWNDVVGSRRDNRAPSEADLAATTIALDHEPLRPHELRSEPADLACDAMVIARTQASVDDAVGRVLAPTAAPPEACASRGPRHPQALAASEEIVAEGRVTA
jgi:hypothetical protein